MDRPDARAGTIEEDLPEVVVMEPTREPTGTSRKGLWVIAAIVVAVIVIVALSLAFGGGGGGSGSGGGY